MSKKLSLLKHGVGRSTSAVGGFSIAMIVASVLAAGCVTVQAQSTLLLGHYDGDTGNGGLDANYAVVDATALGTDGVSISTSVSKWGGGSLLVSGTGTSINLHYGSNGALSSVGTLEMWVKPNGWTWDAGGGWVSGDRTLALGSVQNLAADAGGDAVSLLYGVSPSNSAVSGGARMYTSENYLVGNAFVSPQSTATGDDWAFVAMVWNSTSISYYLNGSLLSTSLLSASATGEFTRLVIGTDNMGSTSDNAMAYLDDVRLSNYEVYTGSSFAVPTGPLQVVPEPSTIVLLVGAAGAFVFFRKSRKCLLLNALS